jgi:hypothetical protein
VYLGWAVDLFWFGALIIAGLALMFFIFAGAMTGQRFPFPFEAPVAVTFPALDSLQQQAHTSVPNADSLEGKKSVMQVLREDLNDDLEDSAFKAYAVRGDLLFSVPMHTLWPFLLAGFFSPIAVAISIAWQLRQILKSISAGRPFELKNIRRVKIIGWLVLVMGPIDSLVAYWSASTLLPKVADFGMKVESAANFEFSSVFAGILILALVYIFQAGARLQRENELTI